jgi:anti-anti-sigma factor
MEPASRVRAFTDQPTVPRLNEVLEWLCRQSHHQVTIDVAGVNFIDSSGLAAFVHAHQTLTAAGGRLALAHPSRPVQRLLSLTGLDHELPTQ